MIDFQPWGKAAAYLDARDPLQFAQIDEFRAEVATVRSVHTPRTLPFRLPFAAQQLRSFARECRADVVLTLGAGSNAAAAYLSGIRPYVVYVAGSDILKAGWPQRQAAKVTLASALGVVANGVHLARRTLEVAPEASVLPWLHGIDLGFFFLPRTPVPSPRFVCARPFLPAYDNATIIRAFASLSSLPRDLDVSFLSYGPLLSESMALADAVISREARPRIRFVGWVSDAGMRAALHSASCYVSSSFTDGTSSSLLEAMACGLFPIVSDIPANREWIVDGENGMLFPPGDHAALASCLQRAIAEQPWMSSARDANRRLLEQRADVDVNMPRLTSLLTSATPARAPRSRSLSTGQDARTAPLRVAILMSVVSPWARLVSSRLAAYGLSVHVADLQPWGERNPYLDARDPFQADRVNEFRAMVSTVRTVRTPRLLPFRLSYSAHQLRAFARRCRADVVLTLGGGSNAAIAYLSAFRPYVVYTVGSDVLMAGWPQRQAARFTLASAGLVVSNGRHLAQRTQDLSRGASVMALYEGIDLPFYRLAEAPTTAARFVCARPFLQVYDNATIIRAVGSLTYLPPDMDVSFLSFGPLLTESIALADSVIPPDARTRVRFVGWVSDAGMRKALYSAACYVSASLSDGTSSSLLEAMACGLFPIVSDIPANREWIVDGENGMLFPAGDHLALAACLKRAVDERPWMSSARARNRRLVEERADVDTNMQVLAGLLRSLGS